MKFIDPRTDFAFKKIFGNEKAKDIVISFLNGVMSLKEGYLITKVEIIDPYQAPKLKFVKETFVDVRCIDQRNITYIVEMQVQYVQAFEKRVVYNASKAYVNQLKQGDGYPKLNQVISINILDFILFDEITDRYITTHIMKEDLSNTVYLDEIRYYFIELPKFQLLEKQLKSIIEKWIFFIKNTGHLDVIPESLKEKEFLEAFEIANVANMSEEEFEYYEAAETKIHDEIGMIEAALEKGFKLGKVEGEAKGRAEEFKDIVIKLLKKKFEDKITDKIMLKIEKADAKKLEQIVDNIFEIDGIEILNKYFQG